MIAQLFILGLIAIAFLYRRYRRMTLLARYGFKGPKPNFWAGSFGQFFSSKNNIVQVDKWFETYGPIVAFYVGGSPTLLVKDEELLKAVLIKDFQKFPDRHRFVPSGRYVGPMNKMHLINTNVKRWKETRSIVTPTFNSVKLRGMVGLINETVDSLLARIEQERLKCPDKEFDIYPIYQGLTMDAICRAAFGIKTDCQKMEKTHPLIRAVKEIFGNGTDLLVAFAAIFPEYTSLTSPIRYVLQRISSLIREDPHDYLDRVIRNQILSSRLNSSDSNRKDLLQNLIEARVASDSLITGKNLTATLEHEPNHNNNEETPKSKSSKQSKFEALTEDEIVANSFLFLVAGFETTSTSLAYITHCLVNHPDVQDRIREESRKVLEQFGQLDYNVMSEMPYLEAVVQEVLRLYPPVTYFVNRVSTEDYRFGDKLIPAGTGIMAPVPQLHRDPTVWPEPSKFDPLRFYGERRSTVNWNYWMPFGAGPRNCVGMRFALMEIKLALSKLLLRYRFEAGPTTEIGDLNLKMKGVLCGPLNGINVKVVKV